MRYGKFQISLDLISSMQDSYEIEHALAGFLILRAVGNYERASIEYTAVYKGFDDITRDEETPYYNLTFVNLKDLTITY